MIGGVDNCKFFYGHLLFFPKLSRMVFNEDQNAFINTHIIESHHGGFLYGLKK